MFTKVVMLLFCCMDLWFWNRYAP